MLCHNNFVTLQRENEILENLEKCALVFARCSQTKQQTLKKEKQIYGNKKRKNIHQLQSCR